MRAEGRVVIIGSVLHLTEHRHDLLLNVLTELLEVGLPPQVFDSFVGGPEIDAKRPLDANLAVPKVLGVKDLDAVVLLPILAESSERVVEPHDLLDLILRQVSPLVPQALIHFGPEPGRIDKLHFATALRRLVIRNDPHVGRDASVVEELLRHFDDCFHPVVLHEPPPNLAL